MKTFKAKFIIFLCICTIESLYSQWQTISSVTFTAEVLLHDAKPPIIQHKSLKNISPLTKLAIIYGTATDDTSLQQIDIHYKKLSESSWSTHTFTYTGVKEATFYFQILPDFITESIEYRISAYDGINQTLTEWYQVEFSIMASAKLGLQGGEIVLHDGNPFDGETFIFLPQGALDKEATITITEVDINLVPKNKKPALSEYPLKVYKFEPSGLRFKKPVQIGLLYLDLNNDGKVDGTGFEESILSIFWYDGVNWRNLRSFVDKEKNLIISWVNHFTYFAVFPVGSLTKDDYRPKEKIITPNNDGINDVAIFDNIPAGTEIKIFNLRGKIVRKITDIPYEWDGKDEDGKDLEAGPYIYQFKINGELISGVIVIAR